VCRVPISSARTLRSDCTALDGVGDERTSEPPARLLASSEDVQLSGGWDCPRCTMRNAETVSRCAACNCRRPSEHKQLAQEAPQRYQIVPARMKARGKKRKPAAREEGSPPAAETSTEAIACPSHDDGPTPVKVLKPSAQLSVLLGNGARKARTSGASSNASTAASTAMPAIQEAGANASDAESIQRIAHPDQNAGGDGATNRWDCDEADGVEAGRGERVPLVRSIWNSKSGFKNVHFNCSERAAKRPWQAKDDWGKSLGMYARPEEAAAAYSRWLGHDVAARLAAAVDHEAAKRVMSRDEVLEAARREGLTLAPAIREGSTPFRGVYKMSNGPRCFLARMYTNRRGANADGSKQKRGGNVGCFHSAEEAALALARAVCGAGYIG
jgi:hypothetical protein